MNNKYINRIALLFLAVAITVTSLVSCVFISQPPIKDNEDEEGLNYEKLELIDSLFKAYTLFELDEEALMNAILKGYIEGTGDRYAEYFTAEEYEQFTADNKGEMVGIGVSVVQNAEKECIEILNVLPNSPALEAGVLPGDLITHIGIGEAKQNVSEIGYTKALDLMKGEIGSVAEFCITRTVGDVTEEIEFSVVREKVVSSSVTGHVCETDPKVGVVKITEFNLTTPKQFTEAVDRLLAEGCDKFVFDVRYNPGGDLRSIKAVLSYFLCENDVYIRIADREGNMTEERIKAEGYLGNYSDCSVSKNDIGKYRDLKFAVLANGSTASAAELFTSALMDHGLSITVGTKTYGKGTMQTTYSLASYGYGGALKLTTKYYYPPLSDSYDGIGIIPDHEVELSEELKDKNIYTITDAEDNQLGEAIKQLYNK